MAAYTATNLSQVVTFATIAESENTAGVTEALTSTFVNAAQSDGGPQVQIIVDVPVIYRRFDTGFQTS